MSDTPDAAKHFTILRQQHAKLFVEREHMVINVKRNILAGFQRKLGAQENALKKAEWEVNRLKREMELVRSSDGEVDYDRISGALDEEFESCGEELEKAPQQIEWANKRFSAMMSMEQTHQFQARYRRLSERLHPETRVVNGATVDNLWERAREAFATGEFAEMEAIELLAGELSAEAIEQRTPPDMEERIAKLKSSNRETIDAIAAMRQEWPFPLGAKLPDEKWVTGKRREYEEKTAALIRERETLAGELNRILDTRP
ncbi:MAG TPA: hypothetical protein VHY22_11275 [Chthoniobacteraceae bacterium]|jgi:hypothetical protein|nr:hypothetical protein [Chthoniobacteraceae bacterium]